MIDLGKTFRKHYLQIVGMIVIVITFLSMSVLYDRQDDLQACQVTQTKLIVDRLNRSAILGDTDRRILYQDSKLRLQRDLLFGGLLDDLQSPSEGIRKSAFKAYVEALAQVEMEQRALEVDRIKQEDKRKALPPYPNVETACD